MHRCHGFVSSAAQLCPQGLRHSVSNRFVWRPALEIRAASSLLSIRLERDERCVCCQAQSQIPDASDYLGRRASRGN